MGFLNPLLYARADAFNDITQGNNPGCGTSGFQVPLFIVRHAEGCAQAQEGWDPVTGLGTLNFQKLLAIVQALP